MKIEESVEKHFSHRWRHYTEAEQKLPEEKVNPLLPFLKKCLKGNEKILDVGCGSGFLLNSIKKHFPKTQLYGIDLTQKLVEEAKKRQNKEIVFKRADILNLPFEDNSFDVVLFKDLLHHVVRETQQESKQAVLKALQEMGRVAKKNAYLLAYEEVVGSKLMSAFLFRLSKICLRLGISIPFLYIHKYVVISFLTEKELTEMLEKTGIWVIEKKEKKIHLRLRYKINLIMPLMLRNVKNLIIIARIKNRV